MLWDRAWSLEDTLWSLKARLHKELDLLLRIKPETRYLTWWTPSNKFPNMIQICENLARILCHARSLKCDDICLKGLPPWSRVCSLCDLYAVEDASNVIMQ